MRSKIRCAPMAACLTVCLAAAAATRGAPPDDAISSALQNVGIEQRLNAQVPLDLGFLDAAAKPVRIGDYLGEKPVILSLVYYECPMLCNLVLNGLLRSLRALPFDVGAEFEVITISFDPLETAELATAKKKSYLQQYGREGAENGWHFLTGKETSIRELTGAVGFRYRYNPQTDQYAHSSGLMVLTPEGRVSRYFYGVEYSARDLRLGLVEASEKKIGSLVDEVLLLCMQYDPARGKYGLVIMGVMRLAGAMTVVLIAGGVALMLFRESRQKKLIPARATRFALRPEPRGQESGVRSEAERQ